MYFNTVDPSHQQCVDFICYGHPDQAETKLFVQMPITATTATNIALSFWQHVSQV